MKERWKGLGDGGFGQIVYTVLALVMLTNLLWVPSVEAAGTIVAVAAVLIWCGWFADDW